MPLSWNEIKARALEFSNEWADETSEDAEAKTFWDQFFRVFGIPRRRVATFEKKVKKIDGKDGYIDLLWKGMLLIEHKSRGKSLDRAHTQARDYFSGLKDHDLPRYLLVSDFGLLRLYDMEGDADPFEFPLKDLHKHVRRFAFLAGYEAKTYKEEDPVNIEAAESMGKLHDALLAAGYAGHPLEVLLVRLLFCLFAEDTGIFPPNAFHDLISQRTSGDGADLGLWLGQLFQTLNTDVPNRQMNLDEQLNDFPYVNGKLFEENIPLAAFDSKMHKLLLAASRLKWSLISPAIFGSMFQSIMDKKKRRHLGAHYTSEKNILKLIGPLFLDGLKDELEQIGKHTARLQQFHKRLAALTFMDPACGCGNFLVIAYRELRLLELAVLRRLHPAEESSRALWITEEVQVDVDQFYGIEVEEFPAQIAQVAMWLMDHQMNIMVSEAFGNYFARLPLRKSPSIHHGDALRLDWSDVVSPSKLSYILGNPPFVGAKLMDKAQRASFNGVAGNMKNSGLLDFVSAWYLKAIEFVDGTDIRCAFVSTNSITQGEQVGVLWSALLAKGLKTHFAHRTFLWNSEGKGKAAVHCVIIGFGQTDLKQKRLFEYIKGTDDPHEIQVRHINPYLVDAPDLLLENRTKPVSDVPKIGVGNKPIDGGYFLFTSQERANFVRLEPRAGKYFRQWLGATEFLNGIERWCLFLGDADPKELRAMPAVLDVLDKVRQFRLGRIAAKSGRESKGGASSLALAATPSQFHVTNIPPLEYLLMPRHSSEARGFIPFGFMPPDVLSGDANLVARDASIFHFGVLQSAMHMAWTRTVCGRIKSDFRYSAGIVYNNFPWPTGLDFKHEAAITTAAQSVLDARATFLGCSLADLYDPSVLRPEIQAAHKKLDSAVDAAYVYMEKAAGRKSPRLELDAERVAFLITLLSAYPSLSQKKGKLKKIQPGRTI